MITVTDFINDEILNLIDFEIYWRNMSETQPTAFPKDMTIQEWVDNYLTWVETKE